jgi:tetrahydromethanopterin S-methyltransferase subunit C
MKYKRASSPSSQRHAGGILLAVGIVSALLGIGLAVYQARATAAMEARRQSALAEIEAIEVRAEAVRRRLISLGEKLDY